MTKTYEVEIKSLLGSKEIADQLLERMKERADFSHGKTGSQLNHYFLYTPDDASGLLELTSQFLPDHAQAEFSDQLTQAKKISIRTRQADGTVYFVAKLSVGDDSSANGVLRHEIQEEVDMTLDELDRALLDAGLEYQAKWSRDRREFKLGEVVVTIDKNAGYGYLAEFEIETEDPHNLDQVRDQIKDLMNELGVKELSQDRLDRMFQYYNTNWQDYYGTEDIFTIE